MNNPITFTKVRLPWGWLGNMSPHPVEWNGKRWPTTEHLFQAMRFPATSPIRETIRSMASPMAAKMKSRKHDSEMSVVPGSEHDLSNMRLVIRLKVAQHSNLKDELMLSGDQPIIEDVTRRAGRGSAMFWGAALIEYSWQGENRLGRLWMELRDELRGVSQSPHIQA